MSRRKRRSCGKEFKAKIKADFLRVELERFRWAWPTGVS